MDWFVLAIISVFLFSFSSILRRLLMRDDKTDAIASSIVFQFLGAVIVGVFALYKGFVMPPIDAYLINYFLVGTLWGFATFCQFKAYQYLEASEAIIISTLESVVIIFAASFFLKEVFTIQMVIGTILVLTGVVLISKTKKKIQFNRGILYSLGFCFFAGLGVINDTFMVKNVDAMSYLTIAFLLPSIFLAIIKPKSILKIKEILRFKFFSKIFLLTFFYSLGAIIYVSSILNGAQVSQLGVISNSVVILTVLLATIFLKERDHLLRKILCAILVFIGVILLK